MEQCGGNMLRKSTLNLLIRFPKAVGKSPESLLEFIFKFWRFRKPKMLLGKMPDMLLVAKFKSSNSKTFS